MRTFCTIITANYYAYAVTLYNSLIKFDRDVKLQVLITNNTDIEKNVSPPGIELTHIQQLLEDDLARDIYKKYAYIDMDYFRWSMKPLFITYLLKKGFEQVIYTDCDIFFYNNYNFLFEELDSNSILLTPHWYSKDPSIDDKSFVQLLTKGIFNAGFIGSNKRGIPALQWWANACHFKMGHHKDLQIFDDQKYLDFLPSLFENVKILKHKGCNLGSMNQHECKREKINNKVLIDGKYPIIFIHFGKSLVKEIEMGFDPLLIPYLIQYKKAIKQAGVSMEFIPEHLSKYDDPSLLQKLKWKIRIRTRIKRFLYKMIQSI